MSIVRSARPTPVQVFDSPGRFSRAGRAAPDPEPTRDGAGEAGFVLVSVIWLVALIALLAGTFALAVRLHVKAAANLTEAARAEALADGLARLVALEISTGEAPRYLTAPLDRAGRPLFCHLADGFTARIAVQDQAGLVDLNAAPAALIERLIEAAGFGQPRAERLAAAIVDFRDADDIAMGGGAEAPDYRREGLLHGPANASFQVVEELDQVLGFEPGDLHRLLPWVTVHAPEAGPDPRHAPAALRSMLGLEGSPADGDEGAHPQPGRVHALDVSVRSASGGGFRRRAIVVATNRPGRPFATLEWRQVFGQPETEAAPARRCYVSAM